MFREDPHRVAFKIAVEATLADIRRDRAGAPKVLKKVFTVVGVQLLDSSLDATRAWKAAGIRNRAIGTVFKAHAGVSLKQYIDARRIEVADVVMATTDLDLLWISEFLGFTHYPTFTKAYERQKNKLPSEVPREVLPPALIDDLTSLKAGKGLLDNEEFVRFLEDLQPLYPAVAWPVQAVPVPDPEPLIIVHGARSDRLEAEDLWRKICGLTFEEQSRKVRGHLFHSEVLFDLLRKKSRLEGRKSRQRGIKVAKLALVSLERSDEVFGERIHDLRALAWAWIGNAYRLALDFSASSAAFEMADREWSQLRKHQDLVVLANICRLKGVLRMFQRDYAEATKNLDRSCSLCRQMDQPHAEAKALVQRASVQGYAGMPTEAVEDLQEAAGLIDADKEPELAFAIQGNLANALVRAGHGEAAEKELGQARQMNRAINDPLGTIKLDWTEGDLRELQGNLDKAKVFYQAVRAGFSDLEESRYFGLATVDLMAIHSQQGEWAEVGELALKTLPILNSMSLHNETVASVGLLAEAVEVGIASPRLLRDLRAALRKDPLAI